MAYCGNCIHLDVCKTADSCDGHVPRCKHFIDKDTFKACFGLAPWTCRLGSKGCYPDGGCRNTKSCVNKVFTHADQLRAMTAEQLAVALYENADCVWCVNAHECGEMLDAGRNIEERRCIACVLNWLQQPAEGPL